MEIVSFGKKKSAGTVPAPAPSISITAEAAANVQRMGQNEYGKVMNALANLIGTMEGTVLFRDLARPLGEKANETLNIRFSMLDLEGSDKINPVLSAQFKDAQRKLFLEFAKVYNLTGIIQEKGENE